jgi:hypothetical protein
MPKMLVAERAKHAADTFKDPGFLPPPYVPRAEFKEQRDEGEVRHPRLLAERWTTLRFRIREDVKLDDVLDACREAIGTEMGRRGHLRGERP